MSIFNQNNDKENSEEILYQSIKDELGPILEEWDRMNGKFKDTNIVLEDPERARLIKETGKLVLQFIWKKLGMKIPDYTRRTLDDDYNILEYKQENK